MQDPKAKSSRRGFFLTASVAGAAVAATSIIKSPVVEEAVQIEKAPPERGGGYSLSEHVKRYYKTTLV